MEIQFVIVMCLLQVFTNAQMIPDWLITNINITTQLVKTKGGTLQLTNGLIHREFIVAPDFATIDYYSYEKQSSLLRAVGPEAIITLDGHQYNISGILTDIPRAYLNRTALALDMRHNPSAFHYAGHSTADPEAPFKYTPKRGAPKDIVWPPKGLRLDVTFQAPSNAPPAHQQVKVRLHYEMYDGIPLMVKWLTVDAPPEVKDKVMLRIDAVEYLALNWPWAQQGYKWLSVESNEPHGSLVNWITDPLQHTMPGSFEPLLTCSYYLPPTLPITEFSESFRVQEVVHGSSDPERIGLAKKKKVPTATLR